MMLSIFKKNSKSDMKKNNIFLCYTSFHLALVTKLLQSDFEINVRPKLIFVGIGDKQSENYISRLENIADVYHIKKFNSKFLTALYIIYYMICCYPSDQLSNFYCPNYKLTYSRLILLFMGRKCSLYGYDDGVGNLLSFSWFDINEHWASNLLFKILKPELRYENLKNIPLAFTQFPELASESVFRVDLIDKNLIQRNFTTNNRPLNILLGQSYSNNPNVMSQSDELALVELALLRFNIDIFIPHPSSEIDYSDLADKMVFPEVIAEQYIAQMLREFNLQVFGFRTSTIINLEYLFSSFLDEGRLNLINLTVFRDGEPLSASWKSDIWSEKFPLVPIEVGIDQSRNEEDSF